MPDSTVPPRSLREIIDDQLTYWESPNFDDALADLNKHRTNIEEQVGELSKLETETRELTFGRDEDFEEFKKTYEIANSWRSASFSRSGKHERRRTAKTIQ